MDRYLKASVEHPIHFTFSAYLIFPCSVLCVCNAYRHNFLGEAASPVICWYSFVSSRSLVQMLVMTWHTGISKPKIPRYICSKSNISQEQGCCNCAWRKGVRNGTCACPVNSSYKLQTPTLTFLPPLPLLLENLI